MHYFLHYSFSLFYCLLLYYFSDGEVLIGTARPSYSVQQLIHSVSTLWDMQLPPEFVSVLIIIVICIHCTCK